ncbi:MAG: diguanylate cyclase [Planctomycetota bacterium]|nr:diguanylate cyclase [Planctomycetota bacterium]
MRPDSINWSRTQNLMALEFPPHRRLHRQVLRCMLLFALLQPCAALGLLHAARELRWAHAGAWWAPAAILFAAAGCTLLVSGVPLLFWMRNWSRGLASLHQGIRRLTAGMDPKPITITGEHEIAYLGMAFNGMAGKLAASYAELSEANRTLEIRVAERTTQLRAAAVEMERLAKTDLITGLANRRAFTQGTEQYFERSTRTGKDLVCIAIDLDGFKGVNDTLGHARGDEMLKISGEVIRDCCRSEDLPARLGGDEFIILLHLDEIELARPVAERLQSEFRKRTAAVIDPATIKTMPSMSIGIASRRLSGAATAEALIHEADELFYKAKRGGKCRAEFSIPKQAA